ncbi:hypothetical protein CEP54_003868 [Fusarium duplospermum]|uniref:Aminoglycoside phosphotransferase domain-containing protein n=1 Tax=Fusarium duplospermum TaxID=1325734 RepID=A0A428QL97_9HYPO|nr:hypothetical protein CEP54_003868 [Fusarium duplospermum]
MSTTVSPPTRRSRCTIAFVVPQELLAAVPSDSSLLVRLPSELLLYLFSHTTDPLDRLCLALTCRRLLQIPELAALLSTAPIAEKVGPSGCAWETKANIGSLLRLFMRDPEEPPYEIRGWDSGDDDLAISIRVNGCRFTIPISPDTFSNSPVALSLFHKILAKVIAGEDDDSEVWDYGEQVADVFLLEFKRLAPPVMHTGKLTLTDLAPRDTFECRRGTLWSMMKRDTPLSNRQKWAGQIRETVAALHELGVVWGDVKPDNVLIDNDNNAVVIDLEGGTTRGWVDHDVGGTLEGDMQGMERMMDFIFNDESPLRLDASSDTSYSEDMDED